MVQVRFSGRGGVGRAASAHFLASLSFSSVDYLLFGDDARFFADAYVRHPPGVNLWPDSAGFSTAFIAEFVTNEYVLHPPTGQFWQGSAFFRSGPIPVAWQGGASLSSAGFFAFRPSLTLIVNPAAPSVPSSTPLGTIVATLRGVWNDGSRFTGHFIFVAPHFDFGGVYAISGNNLVVNPAGSGVGSAGGSVEDVTLEAIQ